MPAKANKALVADFYAAFARGDAPALLADLDENIVWQVHGSPDLPIAGTWTGAAAVGEWLDLFGGMAEITQFEVEHMIGEGDLVAVFGQESGIAQATGREYSIDWAHLWTVRDGRLARFQSFLDGSTIAAAFRQDGA